MQPLCLSLHDKQCKSGNAIYLLLIPWSRVLLEKPTGFKLVKKFPAFYGTRRFITAVTSARHPSLSWARWSIQNISPGPRFTLWMFRDIRFYGDEMLAPRPTPKMEDHPLSAVRDCLFNIFAATLHIGGRSSICNIRTHHVVVTGTQISQGNNIPIAKLY